MIGPGIRPRLSDLPIPKIDKMMYKYSLSFLVGQGLEVAATRPKGGSLWVIGGMELNQIMQEVSKKGYRFIYSAEGGKSTKNRAAWYCNKRESELP